MVNRHNAIINAIINAIMIGATAICRGLTIANQNEKDFNALNIPLINPID